jgi:hypothetical protein
VDGDEIGNLYHEKRHTAKNGYTHAALTGSQTLTFQKSTSHPVQTDAEHKG